jgi:lipoate synthase
MGVNVLEDVAFVVSNETEHQKPLDVNEPEHTAGNNFCDGVLIILCWLHYDRDDLVDGGCLSFQKQFDWSKLVLSQVVVYFLETPHPCWMFDGEFCNFHISILMHLFIKKKSIRSDIGLRHLDRCAIYVETVENLQPYAKRWGQFQTVIEIPRHEKTNPRWSVYWIGRNEMTKCYTLLLILTPYSSFLF